MGLVPSEKTTGGKRRLGAITKQGNTYLRALLVQSATQSAIEAALRFACKRSGLRPIGSHVLRHTFCSHLAMRGAAPKAIQELAGHSTLSMTLRYMHLAPSALREAIGLLDDFGQPAGNAEAATGATDVRFRSHLSTHAHRLSSWFGPVGIPCGARRRCAPPALLGTSGSRVVRRTAARLRAFESRDGSVRALRHRRSQAVALTHWVSEVRIPPAELGAASREFDFLVVFFAEREGFEPSGGVGDNPKRRAILRANAVKRNAKWVRILLSAGRREST